MDKNKIERINELARKSKIVKLTENELQEQVVLRREYIESYKKSLIAELDNTYYVDENGNKTKVKKK